MNRWFEIGDNNKDFLLIKRIITKFPSTNRFHQIIVITNSDFYVFYLTFSFIDFLKVLSLIRYCNNVVIFTLLYDPKQSLLITIN